MDVKKQVPGNPSSVGETRPIDRRQRRALARLGLTSAGAYVAPTLLALRAATPPSQSASKIVVAA